MPELQSRSYANPRRLPRRNHDQEGPDFLFVAMQGGTAAGGRSAAGASRGRVGDERHSGTGPKVEPVHTICAEAGCSRATFFRWRTCSEAGGLRGLADDRRIGRAASCRPRSSD